MKSGSFCWISAHSSRLQILTGSDWGTVICSLREYDVSAMGRTRATSTSSSPWLESKSSPGCSTRQQDRTSVKPSWLIVDLILKPCQSGNPPLLQHPQFSCFQVSKGVIVYKDLCICHHEVLRKLLSDGPNWDQQLQFEGAVVMEIFLGGPQTTTCVGNHSLISVLHLGQDSSQAL